jgi:hypothetical protein
VVGDCEERVTALLSAMIARLMLETYLKHHPSVDQLDRLERFRRSSKLERLELGFYSD